MLCSPNSFAGRTGRLGLGLVVLGLILVGTTVLVAQTTPEQATEMLLNSARKAYNEKNYPFASDRFREFLQKFGGHKEAPSARYGLALSLIERPEKDYQGAIEQLQPLAGVKDFPEHAFVLYHLGLAQRGTGVRLLAQIAAKPQEANQLRTQANQRFDEAAKQFAAATTAFTTKANVPPDAKQLPIELEWAARSRCDEAEMQLRLLKTKEAQATAAPFVKDPVLAKSRYLGLGLYYHGFASFLLNDFQAAGRSLGKSLALLGGLSDTVFATHARYLLARTHHLQEERTEAAGHYEGVIADYVKHKQAAVEALKKPTTPDEKARLEDLVKGPPPDYVARADFFLGVLLYEGGKFAEALPRFGAFAQQHAGSSLLPEAQLRLGFCQVQLKQFPDALKVLTPLAEKEPRLADQALLWIGRAQVGGADPANAQAYGQALQTAMNTFRQAADKSNQLVNSDPEAKVRRGEILLELADTQQLAKQSKEAAATYLQVLNEKVLPQRDEEVLQRHITALHLAGDYNGSDQACDRFLKTHPKSSLLPAILFRHAENAYFAGLAVEKSPPNAPNRAQELAKWNDEAAKRYQVVIEKYPEFMYVHVARYGLGMIRYRKGEFDKARDILQTIPAAERTGDLALTSYLLADCLIRMAPVNADDALAAGRLQEELQAAVELLDSYIGANPKTPQTADALLKYGLCQQRLAGLLAQPPERVKVFASARAAYERLMKEFPQDALVPQAIFERAKCLADAGDKNGAMNELRRFTNDPLKNASVAPMAVLRMSLLLREMNNAPEAVKVLAECRQQHEANLTKDPARAGWVALLQYHQGVALREAGKLSEARGLFDQVARLGPPHPEAIDAALRSGQCLRQEGSLQIDGAKKLLATPNLKPEQVQAANKSLDDGRRALAAALQYFEAQAEQLKQKAPTAETRARMHYEAAWAARALAEPEVAAARARMQQERLKKLHDEAIKKNPAGKPPAIIAVPEVTLKEVPLQPAEQKARANYQALIAAYPDLPLASDARFELAELYCDRDEYDPAVKLLNEAIDKEPPKELTDKIRLRLGACLAARKDIKGALTQFDVVAQNPKNPLAGQAQLRAGECLIQLGDLAGATKRLILFRDQPPFQNIPGVTDRALLRLGHALAQQGQWDQSRLAHEALVGRFGNSPWVHEARYGIGWAWQNLKQHDNAVNAYTQVSAATATEIGAKAQLQIGLCRLDQKRFPEAATALLIVPFTYDYPELSAIALCEAARTFVELKQHDQAEKLLLRVIKDHPNSKWAEVARERLAVLKKG